MRTRDILDRTVLSSRFTDGSLDSDLATVSIAVLEVNELPIARATISPLAESLADDSELTDTISVNGSNAVIVDGWLPFHG